MVTTYLIFRAFLRRIVSLQERVNEACATLRSKVPEMARIVSDEHEEDEENPNEGDDQPSKDEKGQKGTENCFNVSNFAVTAGRGVGAGTKMVMDTTGTMQHALKAAGGVFVAFGIIFTAWDIVDVTREWTKRDPSVEDIDGFIEKLE